MPARCAIAIVLLAPLMAVAQTESDALLDQALTEYDAGNYEEAYALFSRLHELRPSARTQRALGKTAFELRRYLDAIGWLEGSLNDERVPLTDAMRAEVSALIDRARTFTGRFTLRTNVPGARIEVDGRAQGDDIVLDVGEHEIVAHADGYEILRRPLTVAGGEDETIELTLVRVTPVVEAPEPVAPEPVAASEDPILVALGWTSLALGGAFVVGGAIATAIWADTVSLLNINLEKGACTADPESEHITGGDRVCFDQQDRYRTALPFVWIGYVGGAALLAAGIAMLVAAPGESATQIACAPFADVGLACGARF